MMQGLTDKEIASSLKQGVSTVRRHIDAAAALVGDPGNRFALGVTLERRGWLPTDKESHA
jgi:DNA-binding NarL/FixJ family response regulator